jgi:hypothetical protein
MDTGKTGKYFKYAIGEIVLVVIGILIALQINTWNEQRRQVQAEQEFLEGIKNDLQQDKEYIQWVLTKADEKLNAFEQLNEALPKYQRDSLLKIYLFEGQRTFYPVSGSFESAVAGNEINRYKNKIITQSLIKLYNSTYSRLIDNGQIVDERWSNLSEKHIHERRVKHFEDLDEASYPLLLDDIYFHFIQLSWYKNTLNNAIVEIDKILQHLDD